MDAHPPQHGIATGYATRGHVGQRGGGAPPPRRGAAMRGAGGIPPAAAGRPWPPQRRGPGHSQPPTKKRDGPGPFLGELSLGWFSRDPFLPSFGCVFQGRKKGKPRNSVRSQKTKEKARFAWGAPFPQPPQMRRPEVWTNMPAAPADAPCELDAQLHQVLGVSFLAHTLLPPQNKT